jgi:hypothetical protein
MILFNRKELKVGSKNTKQFIESISLCALRKNFVPFVVNGFYLQLPVQSFYLTYL